MSQGQARLPGTDQTLEVKAADVVDEGIGMETFI
jgi:hypothetical protein